MTVADYHYLEYIDSMKKKRVTRYGLTTVVMILLLAAGAMQGFASSSTSSIQYMHIVEGMGDAALLFDNSGALVAETIPPKAIDDGWVILSDQEPVTISSRDITIVLQKESILSVISNNSKHLKYYLVGGSASFLTSKTFTETLTVTTPIGIYETRGASELFVSSDLSELVFSLGGQVSITNTISRKIANLAPYHYMDLADPFLKEKPLSQNTFKTLSMAPERKTLSLMPSDAVRDEFSLVPPAVSYQKAQIASQAPAVQVEESLSVAEPAVKAAAEPAVKVAAEPAVKVAAEPAVKAAAEPAVKAAAEPAVKAAPEPAVKAAAVKAAPEPVIEKVYIAHTNDGMGALTDSQISYGRLATLVQWGRDSEDRTLLLDAGNTVGGSDITRHDNGESLATVLEMIGYDAIAPGTAEFTYPVDYLKQAAELARSNGYVDILSSNALDVNGSQLFTAYRVYDLDGISVGVIGLSAPQQTVDGVTFYSDEIAAQAQGLVDKVRADSDVVILLGGIPGQSGLTSRDIAREIEGIDLIIEGSDGDGEDGGYRVGNTLIVNAGERLSSIGIVELTFTDGILTASNALSLDADTVNNPSTSSLAQAYGVMRVPEDQNIASYIDTVKTAYAAYLRQEEAQNAAVPEPSREQEVETAAVTMDEPVKEKEVLEAPAGDGDSLAVASAEVSLQPKEPSPAQSETAATPPEKIEETPSSEAPLTVSTKSSITADTEETPLVSEFGVRVGYDAVRENVVSSGDVYHGFSVKPFLTVLKAQIGLQAYFLTDGSLIDPQAAPYTNLNPSFDSGLFDMTRSALSFLDYLIIGDETDPFYLVIDDHTPITFGDGYMVNGLAVRDTFLDEKLGLYMRADVGAFGLEAFADDLYLNALDASERQTGGLRFTFDLGESFTLGVGSLVTSDRSLDEITAYPTLDARFTLSDTRTRSTSLFLGLSTTLDIRPFDIAPMFNESGSEILDKFANFQATGGIDLRLNRFNMRLLGSYINAVDPILALGSLNSTLYSGERMVEDGNPYFSFATEMSYAGDTLSLEASYSIPVAYDFSRILELNDMAGTSADTFRGGISYKSGSFTASMGLQRVGFLSGIEDVFAFSDLSELLSNTYDLLTANGLAQPYASLSLAVGPAQLYADLLFKTDGTSLLKLGADLTVGKRASAQTAPQKTVEPTGQSAVSVGMRYDVHKGFRSGNDVFLMSFAPFAGYERENFAFRLSPYISFDPSDYSLYSHSYNDAFTFGSDGASTFTTAYDIFSDSMALIDMIRIGEKGDTFFLELARDTKYSNGLFIDGVDALIDSDLQRQLAMTAKLDTAKFDAYMYVNNLVMPQFADIGMSVTPSASYQAEIGLSSLFEAKLTETEKRVYAVPSLSIGLPIIGNGDSGLALDLQGSALFAYDSADGFFVLSFDSSAPALLDKIKNYYAYGGLSFSSGTLHGSVGASVRNGMLFSSMYNSLYLRERGSLIDAYDDVYDGSYVYDGIEFDAKGALALDTDLIDITASYTIPFSTALDFETDADLAQITASLTSGNFTFDAQYSRRGLWNAFQTDVLESTASIVDRAITFMLNDETYASIAAEYTIDNLSLHTRVGSYTELQDVSGSYNGVGVVRTVPFVTFGMDISY